jgi:hypothetical protein
MDREKLSSEWTRIRGRGVLHVTQERPVKRTEICYAVCLLQNPLHRKFPILLLYYSVLYILIFVKPGFENLSVYFFRVSGIKWFSG